MSLHDGDDDQPQYPFHVPDPSRPHSIDLSLELEHQLDNESLPTSPALPSTNSRPHSLDPHVLASLITQLRLTLSEVTKERDELSSLYADAQSREANLKDTLHHVSEKCIRLEADLNAATEKQKEDTDAIAMLRSKLEDSRRALMRLQTESRRMSQVSNLSLDLARSGPAALAVSPSARRTSFSPLTGTAAGRMQAHRRISSVSDSGLILSAPIFGDSGNWPNPLSPPLHGPPQSAAQLAQSQPPPASRRISGFFGRPAQFDLPPTEDASEVDELRKEMQAIKEQLEETRHELIESQEANEASETCVNALRTFIAENGIGLHPAGSRAASEEKNGTNTSKWGFRLWGTDSATNAIVSPSLIASPNTAASTTPATPLSRKLGGFFTSRGSISSTHSTTSRLEPHSRQQEPICNGSDSSSINDSVTEPISPASEVPRSNILVQDYGGSSPELSTPTELIKSSETAIMPIPVA